MQPNDKELSEKTGGVDPVESAVGENETPDFETDEPVEAMSLLQCLGGVFVSPAKTFRSLTVKTHLLWPMVILFTVMILTTYLSMDALEGFTRIALDAAMAKNPQAFTPEMMEAQLQMSMKLLLITTPLMALLTPVIKGAVVQGISKIFDGKGAMKATVSVMALSYMILLAGGLVRLPLMMVSQNMVTFSPALFLRADQMATPLANFLMNFDLFTLWYLGTSAIGIREVHRISYGKALITVLIPFFLILLMSLSGVIIEKMMG